MFQNLTSLHPFVGHIIGLATRLAPLWLAMLPAPASAQCAFQQKLMASPLAEYDWFGQSVAISGNTAVVGAPSDDHSYGANAGSVSIYTRTGTTWSLQAWLRGTDGFAGYNQFGYSVAISGDTVAIGVPYDDHDGLTDRGSVYIYVRSGSTWSLQQVLAAGDPAALDTFGYSVAISENTLVVGTFKAGGAFPPLGAAYVFQRSGSMWTQQAKLIDSTPNAGDYFGCSVAISENASTVVVGAYFDDAAGADTGSASVFTRSGTTWTLQTKLTANDAASFEYFGWSVAMSGDTVAVGSAWDTHAAGELAGSIYVFQRAGTSWSQQAKLMASDAATDDQLGWSVGISGNTIVGGASGDDFGTLTGAGAAYIFKRAGSTWTQESKFTSSDPDDLAYFGWGVAITSGSAIVGAPRDTHSGTFQPGSAFVYACAAPPPPPPPPCPGDLNGSGSVNGLDLALLLSAWTGGLFYCPGGGPYLLADLNQDCAVNGLDLALLLVEWGPCP